MAVQNSVLLCLNVDAKDEWRISEWRAERNVTHHISFSPTQGCHSVCANTFSVFDWIVKRNFVIPHSRIFDTSQLLSRPSKDEEIPKWNFYAFISVTASIEIIVSDFRQRWSPFRLTSVDQKWAQFAFVFEITSCNQDCMLRAHSHDNNADFRFPSKCPTRNGTSTDCVCLSIHILNVSSLFVVIFPLFSFFLFHRLASTIFRSSWFLSISPTVCVCNDIAFWTHCIRSAIRQSNSCVE